MEVESDYLVPTIHNSYLETYGLKNAFFQRVDFRLTTYKRKLATSVKIRSTLEETLSFAPRQMIYLHI